MTPSKKGESALGKGLDALIRKEKPDEPVKSKKKAVKRKVSNKDSSKEKPKAKKVKKTKKIQIKSSLRA
jgi:hypothetical protein